MEFSHAAGQRYACRDCPARCCRGSLQITIPEEDRDRFLADPWISEHLSRLGEIFEPVGKVPGMYFLPKVEEPDGGLRCAFLEEDMLCGIHRRHGHDYLPTICQTFPFRFAVPAPADAPVRVIASRLCPSIRDNYGEPLDDPGLGEKLRQAGGRPETLAPGMEIGSGTALGQELYLSLADAWISDLETAPDTTTALARIYHLTSRLGESLAPGTPADGPLFLACLGSLRRELGTAVEPVPPAPADGPMIASLTFNILTLPLTHPFRSHAKSRGPFARAVLWAGVQKTFFSLMRRRGRVRLQFCPVEADLATAAVLPDGFPPGGLDAERKALLVDVIRRGSLWTGKKHLLDVVFYLILGHGFIRHYSRLVAAAHGAGAVELPHVREAVSAAEVVLFFHARYFGNSAAGEFILRLFSTNRLSCWKLLAAGR